MSQPIAIVVVQGGVVQNVMINQKNIAVLIIDYDEDDETVVDNYTPQFVEGKFSDAFTGKITKKEKAVIDFLRKINL